jgi:hypothetical protein
MYRQSKAVLFINGKKIGIVTDVVITPGKQKISRSQGGLGIGGGHDEYIPGIKDSDRVSFNMDEFIGMEVFEMPSSFHWKLQFEDHSEIMFAPEGNRTYTRMGGVVISSFPVQSP